MVALVLLPVIHAQPVVWAPSPPQRGPSVLPRVSSVQPVSTAIRVLNQGAKAVDKGVIILEQGPHRARAQPVVWAHSQPQQGLLLMTRVKIAELDSTVIKLLNQVAKAV